MTMLMMRVCNILKAAICMVKQRSLYSVNVFFRIKQTWKNSGLDIKRIRVHQGNCRKEGKQQNNAI